MPILLPPVRAVLEPAKWLSFKLRAAGRVVAKPRHFPCSPPLLLQPGLGLQDILSLAVSWAAPSLSLPHPTRPLQASSGLSLPHCQAAEQDAVGAFTVALAYSPAPAQILSPLPLPHFLWGSPIYCSQEPYAGTPDRRTEAGTRGLREPGAVQLYPLSS